MRRLHHTHGFPVLLAIGFLLFLISCGDDSPPSLHAVSGQVSLPDGCTTDPTTLKLFSGAGESSVGNDNRHTIRYFGRYSNRAKPKSSQDSTS